MKEKDLLEDATCGATSAGSISTSVATSLTRPKIHSKKKKKKRAVEDKGPQYGFLFNNSSYKPFSTVGESINVVDIEENRKLIEADQNETWPLLKPDQPWNIEDGNFRQIHVRLKDSSDMNDWVGVSEDDRGMMVAVYGKSHVIDEHESIEKAQTYFKEAGYILVNEEGHPLGQMDEGTDRTKAAFANFWHGDEHEQQRQLMQKYMDSGMDRQQAHAKAKEIIQKRKSSLRNESLENTTIEEILNVASLDLEERIGESFDLKSDKKKYGHYYTDSGEKHPCQVHEYNGNLAHITDLKTGKSDYVAVQDLCESKKKISEGYEDRVAMVAHTIKSNHQYGIPREELESIIEKNAVDTTEFAFKNIKPPVWKEFVKDVTAHLAGFIKRRKVPTKTKPADFVCYVKSRDDGKVMVTEKDLRELANFLEEIAGDCFPDCDPTDRFPEFFRRKNWKTSDAEDKLITRACRKYLHVSSYYSYLADLYDGFVSDNPGMYNLDPENNPWRSNNS